VECTGMRVLCVWRRWPLAVHSTAPGASLRAHLLASVTCDSYRSVTRVYRISICREARFARPPLPLHGYFYILTMPHPPTPSSHTRAGGRRVRTLAERVSAVSPLVSRARVDSGLGLGL
jgi:hypothetical protein